MGSYTGLSSLRNHPSRNGFDLSKKNVFSAKVGELLPVYWDLCLPGDKYTLKHQHFTRTAPLETSAYTRIREYFDWFYVPLHDLWKGADSALTKMTNQEVQAASFISNVPVQSVLPRMSLSDLATAVSRLTFASNVVNNFFGFNRSDVSYKLMSYLGYGNIQALPFSSIRNWSTSVPSSSSYSQVSAWNNVVNIFPLLAYQKIYADIFRWSQWESNEPYTYNVDYFSGSFSLPPNSAAYWKSNTMFDLRYANWNKDLLMGMLPDSQYGDVATVSLSSDSTATAPLMANFATAANPQWHEMITGQPTNSRIDAPLSAKDGSDMDSGYPLAVQMKNIQGAFSVLSLRQAEYLQKWKEIAQSGSEDYRTQIYKHFGVKLSKEQSHLVQWIGGSSSSLDISEVVNQNLAEQGSTANIAGKGVGTSTGSETFTAMHHGIIMCIYHAEPLLDYVLTGQDPQLLATTPDDIPIPEFDKLGMQSIPVDYITNSSLISGANSETNRLLGYVPRYIQWKSKLDVINGAFTTTLKSWVSPITDQFMASRFAISRNPVSNTVQVDYSFFKIDPRVLDPIFGVNADSTWDTDQLYINSYFDVKVVRNLDRDGMPY